LETLEIITQIIDNRRPVDVKFMDFAKAFDSVPHRRLLLKVKQYGIRGNILAWVKDFLQGRTQFVSVRTGNSSNSNVLSGVPQGSVLGPILFVVYMNDLPEGMLNHTGLFADDAKLVGEISATRNLQSDIDKAMQWALFGIWIFSLPNASIYHLETMI
jgi:hypothetical protein